MGRSLFVGKLADDDPWEAGQCDVTAHLHALRGVPEGVPPQRGGVDRAALTEARRVGTRLRQLFGLAASGDSPGGRFTDRERLAQTALAADPRMAHVVRERKGRLALANGGTEVDVGRDARLLHGKTPAAVILFGARGVGDAHMRTRRIATCVMPVTADLLVRAGVTRTRVAGAQLRKGRLLARVEHVYAKRVLHTEEIEPTGEVARTALAERIVAGAAMKAAKPDLSTRWEALQLAHRLQAKMRAKQIDTSDLPPLPDSLEACVIARLTALGVETAQDLSLLEADDVLPPALPYGVQQYLDEHWPVRISLGDAAYRVEYDFSKRRALLHLVRGNRSTPPRRDFLPGLGGLTVFAEAGGRLHRLK